MPLTDSEIAGYMGWRGPGVYTASQMRNVKAVIAEAVRREREACAKVCEEHPDGMNMLGGAFVTCADAIRARSN